MTKEQEKLLETLFSDCDNARKKIEREQEIAQWVFDNSPLNDQPIANIRWVPVEKVEANDYNPNSVAKTEMGLLYTSIKHDGYTQPVVTIYDETKDKYVIIDGFHRYTTMRMNADIKKWCKGLLPIVVLEKDINDRMASTVRHNRARGKHSVAGMGNMVLEMLDNGWCDADICKELGMEADELVRLKHVTGFSKLFEDVEYKKAWDMKNQLLAKKKYKEENPEEKITV